MKKLARVLALALIVALLVPAAALGGAKRQYIIPDSDTRYLTESELWEWDYESIGFIFNEIFARHGYNFEAGGKYEDYFMDRPWYTPNANANNSKACYPKLTDLEWQNERLCKEVRADMRAQGTRNKRGKHYLDYIDMSSFDVLSGFNYMNLTSGQKLAVYSAPNKSAWRGANGKASISTNGPVYVAGWEGKWLLVMYETNNGAVRVGYVQSPKGANKAPKLAFEYTSVTCLSDTTLTDDPATAGMAMRRVSAGETLTYLTGYYNSTDWAYVETVVDGKTARGFIPVDALDMSMDDGELDDVVWEGSK